jgi:hypothetical protein
MRRIRPQLSYIAGGWLVLHLCLLVSVPTALCATIAAHTIGAECTCDHEDGQMCPMHHTTSKAKASSDAHSCSCRSTSDPDAAIAASLIGPAAVLAPSTSLVALANDTSWTLLVAFEPLESFSTPDSPPPRG